MNELVGCIRQKFKTFEQAYKHTKASDFIKGTCGLYIIQDEAQYTVDGTKSKEIINMQIGHIISSVKNKTEKFR